MIGIRNADGTVSWVLESKRGESVDLRLRLVRHGQKKANLYFLKKDEEGDREQVFGTMTVQTRIEDFYDDPSIDAHLHIDNRGRLSVLVDFNGKTSIKKFSALHKSDMNESKTMSDFSKPVRTKSDGPPTWLTFALFVAGSGLIVAGILILLGIIKP